MAAEGKGKVTKVKVSPSLAFLASIYRMHVIYNLYNFLLCGEGEEGASL